MGEITLGPVDANLLTNTKHDNEFTAIYRKLVNDVYAQPSNMEYIKAPFQLVTKQVNDGIFIDLGCGIGNILTYAATVFTGMQMSGIERHKAYCNVANEYGDIIEGNIFDYPEAIYNASVVYLYEPMPHNAMYNLMNLIESSPALKYLIINTCDYRYDSGLKKIVAYPDMSDKQVKQNITVYAK